MHSLNRWLDDAYLCFSKGQKVTAKAHGGPIEIFGITVADVNEQVQLQAIDTWMDPLAMFRQIAPRGIMNKEIMNRKVDKTEALDNGPEPEVSTIPAKRSCPDSEEHVVREADSVREGTAGRSSQPTNGVDALNGCPFNLQTGAPSDPAARPATTTPEVTDAATLIVVPSEAPDQLPS